MQHRFVPNDFKVLATVARRASTSTDALFPNGVVKRHPLSSGDHVRCDPLSRGVSKVGHRVGSRNATPLVTKGVQIMHTPA
jgi:hypothetical protein